MFVYAVGENQNGCHNGYYNKLLCDVVGNGAFTCSSQGGTVWWWRSGCQWLLSVDHTCFTKADAANHRSGLPADVYWGNAWEFYQTVQRALWGILSRDLVHHACNFVHGYQVLASGLCLLANYNGEPLVLAHSCPFLWQRLWLHVMYFWLTQMVSSNEPVLLLKLSE